MHVAHLIDSLSWGGAEKIIASFTEVARPRGLDVTVMSLQPFVENNPYRVQMESLGANVKAFSITRLYDFASIPALVQAFRDGQFDIVQTHLSHANILGTLAARLAGVPVVATLHNTHLHTKGYYRARSWAEQNVLRYGAHRIMAVGNAVAEANRLRYEGRVIDIVPNCVKPGVALSVSERKALRIELAGDANRTVIIAVGRLVPQKGYGDMLLAFSRIRSRYPDAFLVIIGDGVLRSEVEEQALSLGITKDVRFLGLRDNVPQLLAAGDIFVNTSYWEGLSIAMLEAMAAGLPILATRVGEAPFMLANGRGLLVQPHDVDALVDGLVAFLSSSTTRQSMGASVRSFVELNYSLDPWLDKILKVYALAQSGDRNEG